MVRFLSCTTQELATNFIILTPDCTSTRLCGSGRGVDIDGKMEAVVVESVFLIATTLDRLRSYGDAQLSQTSETIVAKRQGE
jgi:hypothetical protein